MAPGGTAETVTVSHIRFYGCRDLLVYCGAIDCNHSAVMKADHFPAELPIRSLCARMVRTRCGHRGAEVRPDWRLVLFNGDESKNGIQQELHFVGKMALIIVQ